MPGMSKQRALATAALLAGVLALTGCGGDDESQDSDRPAPTTTQTSSTVRPGPGGDLQSRALTVEDLPAGWAESPASAETARPPCVQLAYDFLESVSTEYIERNFSQGGLGPFLTAVVATVPPGAGSQTLQDAVRSYQTCGQIELNSDQLSFTGEVTPEPSPNLGDESYSLKVELRSATFVLGSKVTLLRLGDTIGSFAFGALNNGGLEQLTDVVARATGKMGA